MMGANMGYTPGPKKDQPGREWRYAVLPITSEGGKTIWFGHYWKITRMNPETFNTETLILTEEEYTLWLLANDAPHAVERKRGLRLYY